MSINPGLFVHLLIYNLFLSILLYGSLAYSPRMWLHRMPPEVVAKVPAKTPDEKRLLLFAAVPFLLLLIVYPIIYALQQDMDWLTSFVVFCAFFAGFDVWDTLILDLLIFCKLTPSFIIIPGTERKDYVNMKYHLISGAKGAIMSIGFSLFLAVALAAIKHFLPDMNLRSILWNFFLVCKLVG
ncbi:MAG TPA: hypothetical protein PKW33_13555 [Anaerolineaceae bacterium]|nr:hypothetical protein [Anaerolineaceae bacterium]HPN52612.1 hypothetical protein [Anaerolineaceae bacterium]